MGESLFNKSSRFPLGSLLPSFKLWALVARLVKTGC